MFSEGFHPRNHQANVWNARYAGAPALASLNNEGYHRGAIFDAMMRAHRVAWAIYYVEWPEHQIDHINGDRADNRIENLRTVTHAENGRNTKLNCRNKSGVSGVDWFPRTKRWRARIVFEQSEKHLGYFEHFEDAVAARKAAEKELNFHPNHGRQ